MNSTEIKDLLGRFYEGETSLAEEKQLLEVFRSGHFPPEFAAEAEQFLFCCHAGQEEIPDPGFDEKMEEKLFSVPVLPLHTNRRRVLYLAGIAAAAALLIGILFTFNHDFSGKNEAGTIRDPEIAYAEAQKALLLLSSNLNTGLYNVQRLRHFDKGIQAMNHFSDFYKYQTIIINPDGNTVHKN
jgi:hypothetical protein